MSKKLFHINANGVAGKCNAKKGNCPFGGSSSHFSSLASAKTAAEVKNSSTYGVLPNNNQYNYEYYENKWSGKRIRVKVNKDELIALNSELEKTIKKIESLNNELADYKKANKWDWNYGSKDQAIVDGVQSYTDKIMIENEKLMDKVKIFSLRYTPQVSTEMMYDDLTSFHDGGDEWVRDQMKWKLQDAIHNNNIYEFESNPFW